jgi:L-serine dehydratase
VGRIARHTLKSAPQKVRILFAKDDREFTSLGNMNEDLGYLGGLLDLSPDDEKLYNAHELAREQNIAYEFALHPDPSYEGRGVCFELTGRAGDCGSLCARSIGGGMVSAYGVNGYTFHWQGDTWGILIYGGDDGTLKTLEAKFDSAYVQGCLLVRDDGSAGAFAEISIEPDRGDLARLLGEKDFRVLPALLPIVSVKGRKPQLFKTCAEWRAFASSRSISLAAAAIEYEKNFSLWSSKEILAYFENIASILDNQIHSLERIGYDNVPDTPMLPVYGRTWKAYAKKTGSLLDKLTSHILVHAFSTNAKIPGVQIVPGPMGTGGGYLFSALDAVREERLLSHEKLIEGLVIAAALGALAYTHTSPSGNAGCAGESGVCCAMAAGAIAQMAGGSGVQVENAASMALQASIGIPCDPIPGGLEFPCITRTIRAAITAPLYADLALSGINPQIPYHEVLLTLEGMRKNQGDTLCGPSCGLCASPTAKRCAQFLKGDVMEGRMKWPT